MGTNSCTQRTYPLPMCDWSDTSDTCQIGGMHDNFFVPPRDLFSRDLDKYTDGCVWKRTGVANRCCNRDVEGWLGVGFEVKGKRDACVTFDNYLRTWQAAASDCHTFYEKNFLEPDIENMAILTTLPS